MRRSLQFGALVVCALIVAACGKTGDNGPLTVTGATPTTSAAPPPPPIVSPTLLNAGPYPTVPRPPLGAAGNPALGAVIDAQQMADFVVGPWQFDDKLITPYLSSFYVISSPKSLMELGPEGVATAAGQHGLVNGFASARQITDKTAVVNAVLRFPDPAAASAAASAMGDAAAKQPVKGLTPTVTSIPGHPEAVASTYPFTPQGSVQSRATVRAFTAHGPYVFMQFAQSVDGLDAATGLLAKAIEAQGPAIDQFKPADVGALAAVPVDPTGLLARTLPATSASASKNAVYGTRGAEHFQSDPIASADLFKATGVTEVAMGKTNVYQAKDAQSAVSIINEFDQEVSKEQGTTPAPAVPALPDSHCLAFPKGAYCIAPAGQFAIEARGDQLPDVQQQVAAQYVILTAK
jgi:hypothetical protein